MNETKDNRALTGRVSALDGLRGVAGFIVLIFHYLSAFHPQIVPDRTSNPYQIADTPLGLFWNGQFSVVVFFILSGFVVSGSAIKRKQLLWVALVLRYLRLALPATASVIFAWCLLSLIPDAANALNAAHPSDWLHYTYQAPIPNFLYALLNGSIGIFRYGPSSFNNALWTMRIELFGSAAIYCLYLSPHRIMRIALLLAACVALPLTHHTIYEGFAFGSLLLEASIAGFLPNRLPILAFTLGSLIGAFGTGFAGRAGLSRLPFSLWPGNATGLIYPIAALLLVYGCLRSADLARAFSHRVPQFLGQISFALYLVHVPLLYTVFAWMQVALPDNSYSGWVVACVFFPVAVAAGYIGTVLVDEKVLRLLSFLRGRMSRPGRNTAPAG
jgi:peptidoglycan/LPS O-acetylase OafA/YrhL